MIKLAPDRHFSTDTLSYGFITIAQGRKVVNFANNLLVCFDVDSEVHACKGAIPEDGIFDFKLVCKLLFVKVSWGILHGQRFLSFMTGIGPSPWLPFAGKHSGLILHLVQCSHRAEPSRGR